MIKEFLVLSTINLKNSNDKNKKKKKKKKIKVSFLFIMNGILLSQISYLLNDKQIENCYYLF
jgi:hypothetical protein